MDSIQRDFDIEESTRLIKEYEDIFLDRRDELKYAFKNLAESTDPNRHNNIGVLLEMAIAGADINEEEAGELHEALFALSQIIILQRGPAVQHLADEDIDEDLVDSIIEWGINYGEELQRMNFVAAQGRNWWSFIEADQIMANGDLRHRHRITIDNSEVVEIDSTPYSDWIFIRHFLNQVYDSITLANEGHEQMIDVETLNEVRALLYLIEQGAEELGIELPAEEELIPEETDQEDNE